MTLYTKYRPKDFSEMVGNQSAITALVNALEKTNHSHVYLFSGPPGTGKTTAARIMAEKLGASKLDIREINTATNRGIDTARDILSQMRNSPLSGKCVVYILDECHKFTNDMQNALLKPLEDTPEHVYFFLCTTDPQKLITPLKSRCTEVKFTSLSVELIIKILRRINKLEGLGIGKDILEEVADRSEGCPRKAIVLLERISSFSKDEDRIEFLKDGFAYDEDPEIIDLCRALLDEKKKWKSISSILKNLNSLGKLDDSEKVRYAVLGYMNSTLLNGAVIPRAAIALEAFSQPTYNNGKFGITLACLSTIN